MISMDLLRELPLFADLDDASLAVLQRMAFLRVYDRGEAVFHEAQPMPPHFHVLVQGTLQIVKSAHSGKETVIRLIRPGDVFAWAPLLDGGVAPATARAMTPASVLKLPQAELLALLERSPSLSLRLLSTLSQRLRDVHEQLHAVVSERARTRLARLILRYYRREGAKLTTPLSHQVISRMVGITYEESVRILGEWASAAWPILTYGRGGRIAVFDAAALCRLAEGEE